MEQRSLFMTVAALAFVLLDWGTATQAQEPVRPTPAQSPPRIWFARAGSDGDGSTAARPLGSTAALEAVSAVGDVIVLLPSDAALNGGLALKPNQALIGLPEAGRLPTITNSQIERNGGTGIVLADRARIWNVRVENTHASGVYGADVTGVSISSVEIVGANRAAAALGTAPGGRVPHGGIVFFSSRAQLSAASLVTETAVLNATGVGIATIARNGARHRLVMTDIRAEGGARLDNLDVGIMATAEGTSSDVELELTHSRVLGRMSIAGRNVLVEAGAHATARARIGESYVGDSGQDGVIGLARNLPAAVDIEILNTIVENAAQTNVEGAMNTRAPADPGRASEARVSLSISGSTIRNAGAVAGFEQVANNILMVSPRLTPDAPPFPRGRFRLTLKNSTVEGAKGAGIQVALPPTFSVAADESDEFDLLMRDATIARNGTAEIAIAAAKVTIDARRNCWGDPSGLRESRVVRNYDVAGRAQLDAAEPIPCPGSK